MKTSHILAGLSLAGLLAGAACAHSADRGGEPVGQASDTHPPGEPPETMQETGGAGVNGAEGGYGSASVYGPGGSDTTGSEDIPPRREPAPVPPAPIYPGTGGSGMDGGM